MEKNKVVTVMDVLNKGRVGHDEVREDAKKEKDSETGSEETEKKSLKDRLTGK